MQRRIKSVIFLWVFLTGGIAFAQENNSLNTYTPYSLYGFGDIVQQGLTYTGNMAGITTGVRDVRQIDYVNPAGATARDSVMNFVLDLGGELKNFYSKSATTSTSYNTGNFHHLAVAFKMGRFGVNFGITPYSEVGYEIEKRETDSTIVATANDVRYKYRGEDGINQIFLNLGFDITRNFAVGVGAKYYFGSLSRYYNTIYAASTTFCNTYSSEILEVSSVVPVFGAQYTLNLDKAKGRHMVFGASFQPGINMSGKETLLSKVSILESSTAYSIDDTVKYQYAGNTKVLMPMQFNVGASIVSTDRWMLGAEFNYQDYSKTEIMGSHDMGASYSVRLGGYYIPNFYDVRYFLKRWTYRGGIRYSQTPFIHNGNTVNDLAISAGISMPMRGAGYLNLGAEVGRRGNTSNGMVQETYVNFTLGITLFESWFRKYQYE